MYQCISILPEATKVTVKEQNRYLSTKAEGPRKWVTRNQNC
jgi:hypothetical protein